MWSQILMNGLIAGSTYTLLGISFGLIFMVSRFFVFSHGVLYAIGAYGTLAAIHWLNMPLPISAFLGIFLSMIIGVSTEMLIYRRLRLKNASSLVLLLVSLGLYILLQNLISLLFGDYIQTFRTGKVLEGINIMGGRITLAQLLIFSTGIFLSLSLTVLLRTTKLGKNIRAVSNDIELSKVSGIDVNKLIMQTFIVGSALAGIAGFLIGLDYDINPTMGMNALMMGLISVIIGGINNTFGIVLGGFFLGMTQQFSVWIIGPQWQDPIAFFFLVCFLLFRPEGFLGKKQSVKGI
jgi:branched-chain amino acid transport system permease protein